MSRLLVIWTRSPLWSSLKERSNLSETLVRLSLSLSIPVYLSISLSLSFSLPPCLCLSRYLSFSPSLSPSLFPPHPLMYDALNRFALCSSHTFVPLPPLETNKQSDYDGWKQLYGDIVLAESAVKKRKADEPVVELDGVQNITTQEFVINDRLSCLNGRKDLSSILSTFDTVSSKKKQKRQSEKDPKSNINPIPIVIVPNALSSLINLYNVKEFLQDGRFVPVNEKRDVSFGFLFRFIYLYLYFLYFPSLSTTFSLSVAFFFLLFFFFPPRCLSLISFPATSSHLPHL